MIKLQSKEHLVYFMQSGMMKLSNYDLHFIQNLQHTIHQKHTITTNQLALLDKLIEKYKRQFSKQRLSLDFLQKLNWSNVKVIDSAPEYTEAFIRIENGSIFLKCPFNKKFIADLRSVNINPFKWNPTEKYYVTEYSTLALKILHSKVPKYYSKINYCPIVTELLNSASQYQHATVWSPTLVSTNGRLIIGATNSYLDDAIKDITLNLELETLSTLGQYGISIASELLTDDVSRFASSKYYETDVQDLSTVIDWLHQLKCDCVFFSGLSNSAIATSLYDKLNRLAIDHYKLSDTLFTKNKEVLNKYKYIVGINFSSVIKNSWPFESFSKLALKKIIKVNNSYPITIK